MSNPSNEQLIAFCAREMGFQPCHMECGDHAGHVNFGGQWYATDGQSLRSWLTDLNAAFEVAMVWSNRNPERRVPFEISHFDSGATQDGFGETQTTLHDGTPESAARALIESLYQASDDR